MSKIDFVEKKLANLLYAIDSDIVNVSYIKKGPEEYVLLSYANHYSKMICITADSLLAIVKDVLKAI